MTVVVPTVDAEGAVKAWLDRVSLRAALTTQRSGPDYLLLSRVGGTPDPIAGLDHPRMTALAHGKTKQGALDLAVNYANAVWNLTETLLTPGVYCFGAEIESGPTETPDTSGTSRYLVVATFHLGAV